MAGRWRYRIWQFGQHLKARPLSEEETAEVRVVLKPAEFTLFERQPIVAQQHGYRVMRTLKSAGHSDRALLAAALLHDIGKSLIRSAWWDRPLVVLGQALLPQLVARWSRGEANGWRRPFVVYAFHAEWGADEAGKAGSSAVTVDLIRRHQDFSIGSHELIYRPDLLVSPDGNQHQLLTLLRWADDRN